MVFGVDMDFIPGQIESSLHDLCSGFLNLLLTFDDVSSSARFSTMPTTTSSRLIASPFPFIENQGMIK